jgi:hypothetical protein
MVIGLKNCRNQTGEHSTLTGAKPMKSIKWIIGVIIIGGISYLCYQAWGIWGVVGFIQWLAIMVVILAFLTGASPRQEDNRKKCDFGHWHDKDEKCPECMARVTERFVTKL